MTPLRDGLAAELVLHERIGDARFLTTTTGDALVALTYNVPLDGARGDARRVSLRGLRFQNDDRRFGLRGRAPREVSGDHPGPHWAKVS